MIKSFKRLLSYNSNHFSQIKNMSATLTPDDVETNVTETKKDDKTEKNSSTNDTDYKKTLEQKQRLWMENKAEKKRKLKERRALAKETKEVGFNYNESLKQTDYYFESGLRKVYPYFFDWNTTAKERWFGRTLHEIYRQEFSRAVVNQPIEKLIQSGKIQVNGQTKSLDYVIKNGDRVSHAKHRHEIPVLGDKIKIIHEDDDYLVLDKPCSIPMHPCGKYRYNSLSIILAKEHRYKNLRTLYRLDRLTSGCVILGKNFKAAIVLDTHIKERTAVKTYVARVVGEFPEGLQTVNKAIDCASRKIGLYWLDDTKGKESKTEFERISYNGHTSVVKCWPKTGRTHQIRLHLQFLGHPIVNDPLYNQPIVWGGGNGKGGIYEYTSARIEENFLKIHTYEAWIVKQEEASEEPDETELGLKRKSEEIEGNGEVASKIAKQDVTCVEVISTEGTSSGETATELVTVEVGVGIERFAVDPECFECSQTYRDPERSDLIMYLHALSYKFGDKKFETDLPEWANENFVE